MIKEFVLAALALAIFILLSVDVYQNYRRFHRPLLTTTHQAVTLKDGSTYYGRIDHLGTDYPVLRDAFIVQRELDQNTKQVIYVIAQREGHLNGADHMIIPATAIAFVEPVSPDSVVGRLISKR